LTPARRNNVGLCSPTLLRVLLDDQVLDFFASVFGEEPILAECSVHDSVTPNGELPFHSDRDGGVLLYVMLTKMDESNGILSYIPATHDDNRYFYVPPEEIARRADSIVPLHVDRGDAVLFDQDIWHRRAPGAAGRRVVKVLYHPASHPHGAVDHLYRQSFLSGLSERQLRAFGIGQPPFERTGYLGKTGRPFRRGDLQTFALYLRRFRRVDLKRVPPNPNYGAQKLRPRPPRLRAPV
jgi:hypothetical protein